MSSGIHERVDAFYERVDALASRVEDLEVDLGPLRALRPLALALGAKDPRLGSGTGGGSPDPPRPAGDAETHLPTGYGLPRCGAALGGKVVPMREGDALDDVTCRSCLRYAARERGKVADEATSAHATRCAELDASRKLVEELRAQLSEATEELRIRRRLCDTFAEAIEQFAGRFAAICADGAKELDNAKE